MSFPEVGREIFDDCFPILSSSAEHAGERKGDKSNFKANSYEGADV
jgi:hypothetical protein